MRGSIIKKYVYNSFVDSSLVQLACLLVKQMFPVCFAIRESFGSEAPLSYNCGFEVLILVNMPVSMPVGMPPQDDH